MVCWLSRIAQHFVEILVFLPLSLVTRSLPFFFPLFLYLLLFLTLFLFSHLPRPLSILTVPPQSRRSDAVEVMKSIRFPNMSRDTLLNIVETEDIIKENPQCLQMVNHNRNTCVKLNVVCGSMETIIKLKQVWYMHCSHYKSLKTHFLGLTESTVCFFRKLEKVQTVLVTQGG